MAVYDQWHRAPRDGDVACKCGTKRTPLYPGAEHKRGKRWQVRWRDLDGKQCKRDFDLKVGENPEVHADAFDKMIAERLRTKTYVDPALAETTFEAYSEQWRLSRGHDVDRAATVERFLRLHCYQDPGNRGKTLQGGVAIGQHSMGLLAQRPSLTQAWIQAMPLAERTRREVVGVASAVYAAAMDDGIIGRNPVKAASVDRPSPGPTLARPWPAQRIAVVRDALPPRWAVIPELGAGSGMRQGELFGLAQEDITFLGRRPRIDVSRQVKIVGTELRFGPLKNRKPHEVPLSPVLALALARHMELHPPREVTLPWHEPGNKQLHGNPVTARLILTGPGDGALRRQDFNDRIWRPALIAAGIQPTRQDGCHALRHTAASVWLRERIDIVRVAAWLGDTVAMVAKTYAHMLPDDDDSDGREAMDAFLTSCAPDVPLEGDDGLQMQAGTLCARCISHWWPVPRPRRSWARDFGFRPVARQSSLTSSNDV